jgi:hypothetical protein
MSRRTPEEILAALDDEAADDEMDRVLAMTPAERRNELEVAGANVDTLHGEADKVHDEVRRTAVAHAAKEAEAEARLRALRPPRSRLRVAVLLAATAALGVPAAFVAVRFLWPPAPAPLALPSPLPSASTSAPGPTPGELRDIALDDCAHSRWRACLDKLDAVRLQDPAGDFTAAVQSARRQAFDALNPIIDGGRHLDDKP